MAGTLKVVTPIPRAESHVLSEVAAARGLGDNQNAHTYERPSSRFLGLWVLS
jgi:hypothetical protein